MLDDLLASFRFLDDSATFDFDSRMPMLMLLFCKCFSSSMQAAASMALSARKALSGSSGDGASKHAFVLLIAVACTTEPEGIDAFMSIKGGLRILQFFLSLVRPRSCLLFAHVSCPDCVCMRGHCK